MRRTADRYRRAVLLAEEFLLLCLDDESGKKTLSSEKLPPALGAALLVELALMERIGVTPHDAGWQRRGRVTITSTKPTDDAELDAALGRRSSSARTSRSRT